MVDTDGKITTIAGTGEPGHGDDDRPATEAQLNTPSDVAVASNGIYIADTMLRGSRGALPAPWIPAFATVDKLERRCCEHLSPGLKSRAQQ